MSMNINTTKNSLLRRAIHLRKQPLKFEFDLTILNLHNLDLGFHCIKWTRGSNVVYTEPVSTTAKSSATPINQTISCPCTLYCIDNNSSPSVESQYEPKESKITLISLKGGVQNQCPLAKLYFNIAQYADVPSARTSVTFKFNDTLSIDILISARYLCLGTTLETLEGLSPSVSSSFSNDSKHNHSQVASPQLLSVASPPIPSPTFPTSPLSPTSPTSFSSLQQTGPGTPASAKTPSPSTCSAVTNSSQLTKSKTLVKASPVLSAPSKIRFPSKHGLPTKIPSFTKRFLSLKPPSTSIRPSVSPSQHATREKPNLKNFFTPILPHNSVFRNKRPGPTNPSLSNEPMDVAILSLPTGSGSPKRLGMNQKAPSATFKLPTDSSTSPACLPAATSSDRQSQENETSKSTSSDSFEDALSFFETRSKNSAVPFPQPQPMLSTLKACNPLTSTCDFSEKPSSARSIEAVGQSEREPPETKKHSGVCSIPENKKAEDETIPNEELSNSSKSEVRVIETATTSQAYFLQLECTPSHTSDSQSSLSTQIMLKELRKKNKSLQDKLKAMCEEKVALQKETEQAKRNCAQLRSAMDGLDKRQKQNMKLHETEVKFLEKAKDRAETKLSHMCNHLVEKKLKDEKAGREALYNAKKKLKDSHKKQLDSMRAMYVSQIEKIAFRDQACERQVLEMQGIIDELIQKVKDQKHMPNCTREECVENRQTVQILENELREMSSYKARIAREAETQAAEAKTREEEKDALIEHLRNASDRARSEGSSFRRGVGGQVTNGNVMSSKSILEGIDDEDGGPTKPAARKIEKGNGGCVESLAVGTDNFLGSCGIRQVNVLENITDMKIVEMLIKTKMQLAESEEERLRLEHESVKMAKKKSHVDGSVRKSLGEQERSAKKGRRTFCSIISSVWGKNIREERKGNETSQHESKESRERECLACDRDVPILSKEKWNG